MAVRVHFWPAASFTIVVLSWIVFGIIFFARQKPSSGPPSKREGSSILGIVLQGSSYAIVWSVRRPWFTPFLPMSKEIEIALSLLTMLLAIASVWFCLASIITLGRQWSLEARLVEGHKLVTEGPYSLVRNPIYTGMLGLLLATGLVVSHWIGVMIAIVVFMAGTVIRVRSEEKLLREAFGAEFEAYARDVSALIPFIF